MSNKKSVLLISFSKISSDPRPNRILNYLLINDFNVYTMSLDNVKLNGVTKHWIISNNIVSRLKRKVLLGLRLIIKKDKFSKFIVDNVFGLGVLRGEVESYKFDFVLAFDLKLLPLSQNRIKYYKLILDAREFYPRQVEGNWLFDRVHGPLADCLCKNYLKSCDYIMTVSKGLQDEYKKEYGVDSFIFYSVPYHVDSKQFPVDKNRIKIVFHGGANRNRRLENLIELTKLLDERFYLDLVLIGDHKYEEELKKTAVDCPRVIFTKPVEYKDINTLISGYDIGLSYFEPTTFNLKHCLPNKLFEYIQAGLMVVAGPSPDIKNIVEEYNVGICCNEFSIRCLANYINSLTVTQIEMYKQKSIEAARRLNFENESYKLGNIFFDSNFNN